MPEGVQLDFHAYGGVAVPFRWQAGELEAPDECLMVGPAGTGKSLAIGKFLWGLMDAYPGTVICLVRKTRVSLNDSFLDTFENEVLYPEHPAVAGRTRDHRTKYVHPNGSELRLAGMDQPRRLFSTQYHLIFVNEVTELQLRDWESLHRALRRPGGPPFKVLMGDCNPDYDFHWAHRRFPRGHMALEKGKLRVHSTHDDNPYLKTKEGKAYLQRMNRSLTGTRHDQLYKGIWGSSEGAIYPTYRTNTHVATGKLTWPTDAYGEIIRGQTVTLEIQRGVVEDDWESRELRWFGAAMDFGWDAPGCLGVWGVDGEKRGYEVSETYYRHKSLDWWADRIADAWHIYKMRFCVCDSAEPRSITHLNDRLRDLGVPGICVPVNKPQRKRHGFDHVRDCLKDRGDDKGPGLVILRDILTAGKGEPARDPELDAVGLPCSTAEEMPALVQAKRKETDRGDVPQEESDPGCADHGCDQLMYMMLHMWRKDLSRTKKEDKVPLNVHPVMLESAASLAVKERRSRGRL